MHGQNHFKFKLERFDEVSDFTITNCAVTATAALTRIFLSLPLNAEFQTPWKQAAVAPILKKGNSALVRNYRPTLDTAYNFLILLF
jgi:hypothetical protein